MGLLRGPQDAWLVARRPQKGHQVERRDRCGHRVDQRMKVQHLMPHHRSIEDDRNRAQSVVDCCKWRDRTGQHAKMLQQQLGRPEGDALGRDPVMDRFQVDAGALIGDDEEKRAGLVLQKQVLGMPPRRSGRAGFANPPP